MQQELSGLMRPAGFQVEWKKLGSQPQQGEAGSLIVVELRGTCRPPVESQPQDGLEGATLASSSVVDGQVLPFSSIDCSALSRFLGPALAKESWKHRNYMYGRAMARVLAHEFYHVIAQTREHAVAGIAKPKFTIRDLMAKRLEFERVTLAQLRER
jgi:hypothetical protein